MARMLVVCCDGTWNDPEDRTHVYRIYRAARCLSVTDPDLEVYYDKGVGTRLGQVLLGGSVGQGLSKNVREAYRWLLPRHRDGTKIFLFGFSRGAFTVRSLAGLIHLAGLLPARYEAHTLTAWQAYKDKSSGRQFDQLETRRPRIHFVGVFDTVGALGIPIDVFQRLLAAVRPGIDERFHNTQLLNVNIARHALAIDERRGPFQPTLWTRGDGRPSSNNVKQVWFPGVHADIGGGYEDKRLAEVPLVWMLEEAAGAGLDLFPGFEAEADPLFPHCGGAAHESLRGGYRALPPYRRPIGPGQRMRRTLAERIRHSIDRIGSSRSGDVVGEYIHCSALERISGKVVGELLAKDRPYKPLALRAGKPEDVKVLGWCPPTALATHAPVAPPCRGCALYESRTVLTKPQLDAARDQCQPANATEL